MSRTGMVLLFLMVCLLASSSIKAEQTVGLFIYDSTRSVEGYTLFPHNTYTKSYLINNYGREINSWESDYPSGRAVYLLENGHVLHCALTRSNPVFQHGGAAGLLEEFDWDGNLVWEFWYNSNEYCSHHDVEPLPNGNILMVAWEYKSYAECVAAGRDTSLLSSLELWPDHIVEVQPVLPDTGIIVWEWHVWDHLIQDFDSTKANYGVVADHPELIDLNYARPPGGADWTHVNTVKYHAEFDQIIISPNAFSELWVVDHSTTTEEAAGHTGGTYGKGGDLLYRWGNPRVYDRGTTANQQLFSQHDTQWIDPGFPGEGNILIFNNGGGRPGGNASSVDEIVPPVDSLGFYYIAPDSAFGPEAPIWSYMAPVPSTFFSGFMGGCQRFANGNTLITETSKGRLFEVTPDTVIVWEYIVPVVSSGPTVQGDALPGSMGGTANNIFKARRYLPDYPGFQGLTLTPGDPIEIYMVNDLVMEIDSSDTEVTLTWNVAHSPWYPYNYYVYESDVPDTGFSLVHTTTDTTWSTTVSVDKKFYQVTMEIFP